MANLLRSSTELGSKLFEATVIAARADEASPIPVPEGAEVQSKKKPAGAAAGKSTAAKPSDGRKSPRGQDASVTTADPPEPPQPLKDDAHSAKLRALADVSSAILGLPVAARAAEELGSAQGILCLLSPGLFALPLEAALGDILPRLSGGAGVMPSAAMGGYLPVARDFAVHMVARRKGEAKAEPEKAKGANPDSIVLTANRARFG